MSNLWGKLHTMLEKTNIREAVNRDPLRDLLRECLPIVEKHALGPSGSDPKVWELLHAVRKEVDG